MVSSAFGGGWPQDVMVWVVPRKKQMMVTARTHLFGTRFGFGVITSPPTYAGRFVLRRSKEVRGGANGKGAWENFWQLVPDAPSVLRQAEHIISQYGDLNGSSNGEKNNLRDAYQALTKLSRAVAESKPVSRVEDLQKAASISVRRTLDAIGGAVKESKKEGCALTVRASFGADRLGRPNQAVVMSLVTAAQQRFVGTRLDEIFCILPAIASEREMAKNMIEYAKLCLAILDEFLSRLLSRNGLRPLHQGSNRLEIVGECRTIRKMLNRVDYRPFQNGFARTARDLKQIENHIKKRHINRRGLLAIRKRLLRCRKTVTIKLVQLELDRLNHMAMRAEEKGKRLPVVEIRTQLARIDARLRLVDTELAALDDRDLKHPVSKDARLELRAGLKLLSKKPTRDDIPKLREVITKTSRKL